MTTADLRALLRARYCAPEYGLLFEVPDATGGRKSRTADALAMSLWPSRGLELHGFELKVSRGDWQRELADPAKAESLCRYCDRWWIVAGDDKIVRAGELPPTWGLLVANGDKLRLAVDAPKLEAQPIGRVFFAALMRKVSEAAIDADDMARREAAAVERGQEQGQRIAERELSHVQEALDDLRGRVEAFEAASGVTLSQRWTDGALIGRALRVVLEGEKARTRIKMHLERDLAGVERIAAELRGLLADAPAGDEEAA